MKGRSRFRSRGRGGANSLLSQATAQLGTAPYHYWDFTTNRALFAQADVGAVTSTPGWSFTRASTGYAQTQTGLLVPFGSGVLRRTDKGALIEEVRTNIMLQSQTLDDATWSKVRASVTANAITAPDGTTTADKLVEDSTVTSTHLTQQFITLAVSTQTISVYAKAAERSQILLFIPATAFADATARSAYYDLATGAVGATSGSGITASISALANGWYRCELALPTVLAIGINAQIRLAVAGSDTYSGDGVSGLYLWGAQLEAGASATSYIPTTTASATRAADTPFATPVSVNYPLSIYAQFNRMVPAAYPSNTFAFTLDDTSANNRNGILVGATSGFPQSLVVAAGATQYNPSSAIALAPNVTIKLAGRVATNDARTAQNGTLMTASGAVTLPANPSHVRFGTNQAGTTWLNGYLLRAAIFNSALADAALQRATT